MAAGEGNPGKKGMDALRHEAASAKNLLCDGFGLLYSMLRVDENADSVFTLLAIGFEKLLKLSLTALALEEGAAGVKDAASIDIMEADAALRIELHSKIEGAAASSSFKTVLDDVENDPYRPYLMKLLQDNGRGSCSRSLDLILGGGVASQSTPRDDWHDLENRILRDNPLLIAPIGSLDPVARGKARSAVDGIIAASLLQWWEMIHRAWTQGLLGEAASSAGFEIRPETAETLGGSGLAPTRPCGAHAKNRS